MPRVKRRIAERHGWREPMLPSHRIAEVSRLEPGALAVLIVEVLNSPADVIHRRDLVVEVGERRPFFGRALSLTRIALRLERWISERHPRRVCIALAHVEDVILVDVPILGRQVPAL